MPSHHLGNPKADKNTLLSNQYRTHLKIESLSKRQKRSRSLLSPAHASFPDKPVSKIAQAVGQLRRIFSRCCHLPPSVGRCARSGGFLTHARALISGGAAPRAGRRRFRVSTIVRSKSYYLSSAAICLEWPIRTRLHSGRALFYRKARRYRSSGRGN